VAGLQQPARSGEHGILVTAERASDPDHAARLVDMARGLHRLLDRTFRRTSPVPRVRGPHRRVGALRFVLSCLMAPTDYDFRTERQMLVDLVVAQIETTSDVRGRRPTPAPGPAADPRPLSDAPDAPDAPDQARSAQP
jgi:hypothetical protein